MQNDELMNWGEVADFFRLDGKTQASKEIKIKNWLNRGVLPRKTTFKIGKKVFFLRSELEKFIMERQGV